MARVANSKDIIANYACSYIITKIQDALTAFHEELDENNKLSASYIASQDSSAKTNIVDAIRMLRWIYETEFGLSPPPPYTNGDVDGIDLKIRTNEDGL